VAVRPREEKASRPLSPRGPKRACTLIGTAVPPSVAGGPRTGKGPRQDGGTGTRRPAFRPRLDALEDRLVLSPTQISVDPTPLGLTTVTQGQPLVLTATVTGGDFIPGSGTTGGTVTFRNATTGKILDTELVTPDAAANRGTAVTIPLDTSGWPVGNNDLWASYGGEQLLQFGHDDPSNSIYITEVVNPRSPDTSTTVAASSGHGAQGQPVTLTATVTGGETEPGTGNVPPGIVIFKDNGKPVAQAVVAGTSGTFLFQGTATSPPLVLGPGTHTLTASYLGEQLMLVPGQPNYVNNPSDSSNSATVLVDAASTPPPSPTPTGQAVVSVSSQVRVTRVTPRHPKARQQQVKLTNTGGTTITGPIYLVLTGLSPKVRLLNAAGTAEAHDQPGDPFVFANVSQLAPGQNTTLTRRLCSELSPLWALVHAPLHAGVCRGVIGRRPDGQAHGAWATHPPGGAGRPRPPRGPSGPGRS
jgi:hypothetical protein